MRFNNGWGSVWEEGTLGERMEQKLPQDSWPLGSEPRGLCALVCPVWFMWGLKADRQAGTEDGGGPCSYLLMVKAGAVLRSGEVSGGS